MKIVLRILLPGVLAAGAALGAATRPVSVADHGIVANNPAAATANQAALRELVSPTAGKGGAAFAGKLVFPNAGGHDVYYFRPLYIEVRSGVALDCQGATLDFTGDYDANNDTKGFLTLIRGVSIENCAIKVDYNGTAGVANGSVLRLGARAGRYGFGDNQTNFMEEKLEPMGKIVIRNVRIATNNAGSPAIVALGGLRDTLIDTVTIDGGNAAPAGINYEFGQWHYEGGVAGARNVSTHATDFRVRNLRISNLAATGKGMGMKGIMTLSVDGLWVDHAATVFVARLGEAGYYNMKGTPTEGMTAHIELRNINGRHISSTGISLLGSESLLNGYLGKDIKALAPDARNRAQTDKITFTLDGFDLADSGIVVNAPEVRIANGTQRHGGKRGIWLQSETMHFEIDDVRVLDNQGAGIASDRGGQIYPVARVRKGSIRNCFVAGNGAGGGHDAGIALGQMNGVLIDSCRFGYDLQQDGVAETTQGLGIAKQSALKNLTIKNSRGAGDAAKPK
jgi:hypothetical protein